jgi:hypothetical protein
MDTLNGKDWILDLDAHAEHGDDLPVPESYHRDEDAASPAHQPIRGPISGAQLRRRLITPEMLAAAAEEEAKPSLLQRLLGRR